MRVQKAGLFGLKHSNRDFTQAEAWGKNCFNSSLPASLCSYLYDQGFDNIYIEINSDLGVEHSTISTPEFYGIDPNSENIFYAFETQFTPYQHFLIGNLPRVDLVIQSKSTGCCLRAVEIKLTALPDNTTCELVEDLYGCEIVVRPDTIVYLACSIANIIKNDSSSIDCFADGRFAGITDWSEPASVTDYVPWMIEIIDSIVLLNLQSQSPFLMQPVWKTDGKSPRLSDHCLDVFVWSDFAFTRLFVDLTKAEISKLGYVKAIPRHTRAVIWLFKMLHDFSLNGCFEHERIIDELSYNVKNDKAFAISGKVTHAYMRSQCLTKPRIKKQEIKNIILGGGQNLLSPERRFDAIVHNSPELFI